MSHAAVAPPALLAVSSEEPLIDSRLVLGWFALAIFGTIVGPVVGVWTSMIALNNLPSGVASALISSSPIFMIPIAALAFGEKHSFRSLVGTVLAVAGVFLLLL